MGVSHTGPVFQGPAFEPLSDGDPAVVSGHRVAARLGTGALGRVYFAHAPGGEPVALTVIRPELAERPGFASRFHRDAQAAGRVRAPFTVPVTGSGKEGERYWIAFAYVPALSLRAAVSGAGPLPTGAVLRLVAGIAEGLRAVHHAGVVHGDLRPSQVLLTADGPRIKDYGIARTSDPAPLTGTAAVGGSPVFRSPEQAAGKAAVPATDVFALGQLAAYASIGTAPFGDGPAHTVLPRVQQEEPDLSELPGELREIVTRCLIKDPVLRPSPAQIIAMCGQASPASTRRRADPWLPPALLAAIVPAMPTAPPVPAVPPPPMAPPVPGHSVRGSGAVPAGPPGPGPGVGSGPVPGPGPGFAPGSVPGSGPGLGSVPGVDPASGRPPVVGSVTPVPGPGLAPARQPGAVPTPAPFPMPPPAPAAAPVPAAGPALGAPPPHPPGVSWHPQTWPRPAQLHVALPRPALSRPFARRRSGVLAVAAGLVVAVTAGVALAGGFDGGRRVAGADKGAAAPSSAPDTVSAPPFDRPTGAPSPTGPVFGVPPATTAPGTGGGGDATGSPQPRTGTAYLGIDLPAGYSLALQPDPPEVRPGTLSGTFGYSGPADAFATDARRGTLALLGQDRPGTLAECQAGAAQSASIPRRLVTSGARLCVRSVDGTTALVTFRQLTPPDVPNAYATVDVTVWRATDQSAESDQ